METYVADLVDMESDKQDFFNSLLAEDSSFQEDSGELYDWSIDFDDYSQ
jgi:hypothetical protein